MDLIRRLRRMLTIADPGVTPRMLDDLGISAEDYAQLIASKPGSRERVVAMARTYGLQPRDIDAHRTVSCEIAKTCGSCRKSALCQAWIDETGGLGTQGARFSKDDCPNAAIFRELAA